MWWCVRSLTQGEPAQFRTHTVFWTCLGAFSRAPALSLSMDLRDLVRQSTRARQKLALLWLASRGAHIPKFSPPPSHARRRSTPSPPLAPPPHTSLRGPPRVARWLVLDFRKLISQSRRSRERLPGFSLEKNGFTRVKVARGPELYTKAWGGSTCVDRGRGAVP